MLHTIGGDDTNTAAADLAAFLAANNYALTVPPRPAPRAPRLGRRAGVVSAPYHPRSLLCA